MSKRIPQFVLSFCLPMLCLHAQAQQVGESPLGEAVERHLSPDQPFTQWVRDSDALEEDGSDRIELREVPVESIETIRLTDVVPPIRFESGVAQIPESYVEELRDILEAMRHRRNVRLHLVGHADNQPLSPALAAIFGDNEGLSRERAGEVAEYLQRALNLPPEAVTYDWAGDRQPVASNDTAAGRALNRRVEVEVWYDEVEQATGLAEFVVASETRRIKVCRMETVCMLRYVEGRARRTRIQNLLPPMHFDEEQFEVPAQFVAQVRQALENLSDRQNVVVRLIGHTDNLPLSGRDERIYMTHLALSRARALRAALTLQDALALPARAVESDGRGADRPLATNDTPQGRALNRRIEVEFWYDDPLQQLPDTPQMCPAPGAELVTRVYEPAWGPLRPLQLENGRPLVPAGYTDDLRRAMAEVADKRNVRLRFLGYTANERLDRRTALVYGDDIGLSAARARRTMEILAEQMQLAPAQAEFEGRGYVHADDVVNAGFIQGESSHVVVQVVYDEYAQLDDYDGVEITPMITELIPQNPFGLNLMRITVDGEPIDDPARSSADIQRCTDVALARADIQFGFDNLTARPRLSVSAQPVTLPVHDVDAELVAGSTVRFRMYANYASFIERAEVRVFEQDVSLQTTPLAVVAVDADGFAEWLPEPPRFPGPVWELKYVLRAYGREGNFDETAPRPLWMVYEDAPDAPAGADERPRVPDQGLLAAYGDSALSLQNITLSSGTVTVRGRGIPPEHSVWVAGREVPVAEDGSFVVEEVLPFGAHTVEVAVLDQWGNGELFLRDLEFRQNDWFYVGMADITLSRHRTRGAAELLRGENAPYDPYSSSDGRLAFYLTGRLANQWSLSASADTREEPLRDLFSNFMNKSPDSLFRRIDPDYHYPTFGDDGTVEESAPTMGKFYVRVSQNDNHALWGNFGIGYMNNELAQVDRGLYGANLRYGSSETTGFGERRWAADVFAAEPGTVAAREEFRGTGGSLYFLRRQDILPGSERVRVEVRDRASGLVTGVLNLRPMLDYDIDYFQGRILLSEPLASTVDDNLLVRASALTGDEVHLAVRYEYTPGFEEIDALALGGQVHYWFGDLVKVGLTSNRNELDASDSALDAADLTVRMSTDSWLKLQAGRSEGLISSALRSDDGGFGFYGHDDTLFGDADAGAYRADVSVGFGDLFDRGRGRMTFYTQSLDAGYSAPGLATLTDTTHRGGTLRMPVTERMSLGAKADRRVQDQGLETNAQEVNVGYRLSEQWDVSAGMRRDLRRDRSPVVPITQEEGERTDAVVQVGYDSRARWRAYGFVQDTVSVSGERQDNMRVGAGGAWRFSERLRMDAELSGGDLGAGGKLGTSYLHSERTSLYLNYTLENERTDNALRAGRGSEGNLAAGVRTRLSDSTSVFLEERYRHNDVATGLTHAAGVSLAPNQRINLAANTDIGTLKDSQTGAETNRRAGGVRVGYGLDALQLSSGIEYRHDESQQPDASTVTRRTWLFRSNLRYQLTPDWRLLAKLNHSESESSMGQFYDGGYTEAVLGYAYRPVRHDRLSALVKYTYFYNVPSTDQVIIRNRPIEFIQKSHVGALDLTYNLTSRWSVGGKYAYRRGQVSLDRENRQFFSNDAHLYVARADWRFGQDWEVLMETRLLDMPNLRDRRSGALVALSRYVGRHLKLGTGYNFTDFSDDLTDLSFDHRGVFVSLTGMF